MTSPARLSRAKDEQKGRHTPPRRQRPALRGTSRWATRGLLVTVAALAGGGLVGWSMWSEQGPEMIGTAVGDAPTRQSQDPPAAAGSPIPSSGEGSGAASGGATSGQAHDPGVTRGVAPRPVTAVPAARGGSARTYPVHTHVQTTWFNVGGVDDPQGGQETQNVGSAWDELWSTHFGGCDGVGPVGPRCIPEPRVAANGYFPQHMTPKENPFYVALPFDDVNDVVAAALRGSIPWAHDAGYAGRLGDPDRSLLKNRWVAVTGPTGRTCYAQAEDAGPWYYHDFDYVFSAAAPVRRPSLDVSPAVFGCLGIDLDAGVTTTSWRFVDSPPDGPWTRVVTTRP